MAASTPSALHRATISGQSISSVVRWLRFVGRPWKRGGQGTHPAALDRGAQLGKREIGAPVLGRGVRAIDRDVGDAQIVIPGRIARIDGIELRGRIVGRPWTLIACGWLVRSGRRDDRQAAVRERLAQRLKRYLRVMGPFVGSPKSEREVVLPRPLHVRDRHVVNGSKSDNPGFGRHFIVPLELNERYQKILCNSRSHQS